MTHSFIQSISEHRRGHLMMLQAEIKHWLNGDILSIQVLSFRYRNDKKWITTIQNNSNEDSVHSHIIW